MQKLLEATDAFVNAKLVMMREFIDIVRNPKLPIMQRVHVWERYASAVLEISDWRSGCPIEVQPEYLDDFDSRYCVVLLVDMVETLIPDEVWETNAVASNDDDFVEKLLAVRPDLRAKFEAVLNSDYAGFTNDW